MKPLATLVRAFEVDPLGTAATAGGLLVVCVALINAHWVTAAVFLAAAAFFGAGLWERMAPDGDHAEQWRKKIKLASLLVLVAISCISAFGGDFEFLVACGWAGVVLVIAILFERLHRVPRAEN